MEQLEQTNDFSFESATLNRTVKNITSSLRTSLNKKYKKGNKETIEQILKVIGVHPDNFDALGMMSSFISGKLNNVSLDANANKSEKTISALSSETSVPKDKAIGFDYLYQEMKYLYGKEEAKRLSGEMYDYSLAISDSSKLLLNYCYSIDFSRLIVEGRPFGQLPSGPCHSIRSYIGAQCETLHQLSQHNAGAIAASTLFFDLAHLCLYWHKLDIRELKTNKWFRKEIENTYQHFVHSMNMLSRDSIQSPFSNISINDKVKIKKVVLEMSHMFPFDKLPINEPTGLFNEEERNDFYLTYIIDYISELQEIFLDFFDKGAPMLNGAQYRFPVATLAISKHRNKKTCEWEPSDIKFLKSICKREIYRYNIFTSEGTKFASCCFDGKNRVLIGKNKELVRFDKLYSSTRYTEEDIKSLGLKPDEISKGKLIVAYNDDIEIEAYVIKLDYDDVMYEVTLENGTTLYSTRDHKHIVWFNEDFQLDVKSEHLYEGNEILLKKGLHSKITSLKMRYYEGPVYCLQTLTKENRFDIEGDIITHNCRLINDTELMSDYASQSNSFGAGGSVSLGSHRVLTINYPRIAYETSNEREFFKLLDSRLEDSAKILKAHKALLKRLTDAGLQMFISNGYMRLDRLFSTFGVIGIYECSELYKSKFGFDGDAMKKILQFVNSKVNEYSIKYGIAGNIEQIPGESMAGRLLKIDRLLFGDIVKGNLYSNQATPLSKNVSVWERLKRDGEINSLLTGGGIAHVTMGEKVTSKIAEMLITFAIKTGCEHFALNAFYSICKLEHVMFGRNKTCPRCGESIKDYMTRIIGYFIRVSDADDVRGEEIMSRPDSFFD